MDVLTRWGDTFNRSNISNHNEVHFKYFTVLYVNYASIKLKFKKYVVSPQ